MHKTLTSHTDNGSCGDILIISADLECHSWTNNTAHINMQKMKDVGLCNGVTGVMHVDVIRSF